VDGAPIGQRAVPYDEADAPAPLRRGSRRSLPGRAARAAGTFPRLVGEIGSGYSDEPRYIDEIEWFASPDDVCRTFAGLEGLSKEQALAPLSPVLSRQVAGIGLDRSDWPTVWYKGGSEPGVLTLGWLATNGDGTTFVVEAMVSNPDAALAPDSIKDLVALAQEAFALLA